MPETERLQTHFASRALSLSPVGNSSIVELKAFLRPAVLSITHTTQQSQWKSDGQITQLAEEREERWRTSTRWRRANLKGLATTTGGTIEHK